MDRSTYEATEAHHRGFRMPFKSQAQRRKFAELLVKGEISPETFEEWNRASAKSKRKATRRSR